MPPSKYFACLDIGTNSVLLLLTSQQQDGTLAETEECFEITHLGEGVDQTNELNPDAVSRTLTAVETFVDFARKRAQRPLYWAIVATSAVRDARNSHIFLQPCRQICGCDPQVMTGEQEAEATYAGAVSDLPAAGCYPTIDIGGGSTELAVGHGSECRYRTSLNMGCVRFGERFGLFENPQPDAITAARACVRRILKASLKKALQCLPDIDSGNMEVIASGGTATSFAAVAQNLTTYDSAKIHGFRTDRQTLDRQTRRFLDMPLDMRMSHPGLRQGRGKVLPAGLLILDECLRATGSEKIRITTRGLRFGLTRLMAEGKMPPAMIWRI